MANSLKKRHVGHFCPPGEHGRVKTLLDIGGPCNYETPRAKNFKNWSTFGPNLEKRLNIHLKCPPRFVLGKSPSRISMSEVTRTAKSSYLANQKPHREFKDSFEMVRIRATTFT